MHIPGYSHYENRHDPFAIYEYMGVTPSRHGLELFLKICDMARDACMDLPKEWLDSEHRAYLALELGQCVDQKYDWE